MALFVNEGERLVRQIEAAPEGGERRNRVAALFSLAQQVGAGRLAEACRPTVAAGGSDRDGAAAPDRIRLAFGEVRQRILTDRE